MSERILKCAFESEWNNKPIVYLNVRDLWASVPVAELFRGKPFYSKVKEDIEQKGMHFPILVVQAAFKDLEQQKIKFKKAINDLPTGYGPDDIIHVVWGGSNRLAIAEELQYDKIACVLYTDFDQAHKDQQLHRAPFEKFYSGPRVIANGVRQLR